MSNTDSAFDLAEGEEIILRAKLQKDKWIKYRCVTCTLRCLATTYVAPILAPAYALLAGKCREEEADSFELILTNQNLHFKQMNYSCGFCCQETYTKIIPLHRIQDLALVSDWIGDKCGVVDKPGEIYQLHVQTAGMGIGVELSIICIENPREFKKKVMEAKNRVVKDTNITGQSKVIDVQQIFANTKQEDLSRILALLERQVQENKTEPGSINA
jgi:hypothetical protein